MAVTVHPTAIVDAGAQLGDGTTVGPYSIIGPHVVTGKDNWIGPHVVLEGHTNLGDGNKLFQFCSVGSQPQDLKYKGEASELKIGNHNIIREFVTLQPGTAGGGMLTSIGDRNLFMANTHVGHDSIVGNRCILANSAGLSGHVTLGDGVIIGGLSGIHQFVRIGDIAMIGAGAMVTEDIPPFCMAQGDRAKIQGLNRLGLERNGASQDEVAMLRKVYRTVFRSQSGGGTPLVFKERVEGARLLAAGTPRAEAFVAFLASSERGIAAPRGAGRSSDTEE
jgi:UDP-N-acetylglucosamine acyltransferase